MKKMKLFLGILIGLLIISSCSSDDDSNSDTGSIIGTWKPIKEVDVCSTGFEDVYDFDSCEQTGRIIFSEDGTLNITEYDLENGNCEQYYNSTGTWTLTVWYAARNPISKIQPYFLKKAGNSRKLRENTPISRVWAACKNVDT